MRTWRSARPGDGVVATDVAHVTSRLRGIAPLVGAQDETPTGDERRIAVLLRRAIDTLADEGRWNRRALERMGNAHSVLLPAVALPGEQVTGDPHRVAAKLDRRFTPVPSATVDACGPLFARTYPSVTRALEGAGGLALKVRPAEGAVVRERGALAPISRL